MTIKMTNKQISNNNSDKHDGNFFKIPTNSYNAYSKNNILAGCEKCKL